MPTLATDAAPLRVLELNDLALRVADAAGVQLESPGFACLHGGRIVVGLAARGQFRVQPRQVQFRYWYQLDQTPLDAPFGDARHHADLAWTQLAALRADGADGPLLLAVPGGVDAAQLSLLLALARAAQLEVVGLVDAAVAAAASVPVTAQVLHLDVQLHRWWLSRLAVDAGGELARVGGDDLAKPGMLAIWDACAGVIASAFVQQTRYDPLHSAATEQALYDRLPDWLPRFGRGPSVTLELPAGLRSHRVSLPSSALDAALAPILGRLAAGIAAAVPARTATTVLLGPQAAAVPGLAAAIAAACGLVPLALGDTAVAAGALAQAARIRAEGEALPFVSRLPAQRIDADSAPNTDADAPTLRPTHRLLGDIATPLSAADAAALAIGDRIDTPDGPARAIHVRERPA